MTKIPILGVITDTHTKSDNYELIEDLTNQFITHLKKIGCKDAVHCGDFFHDRFANNLLDSQLSVIKNIQNFDKNEIRLFAIPGNHDKREYTSEKSYLDVIKYCSPTFKHFSKGGFYNYSKEIRFAFLPYFKEGECYLTYLVDLIDLIKEDNLKRQRKTILFTHTSVTGVKNNDGSVVENDVEEGFFEFFDLVIVGHYHNRQKINSTIHYIASSHQRDFGEDDRKGFAIIYSDLSIKYIDTKYPKYIKIPINIANRQELADKILEHENSQNKVRFILKGSQEELTSYDTTILEAAGIDIKRENTVELLVNFQNIEEAEITTHDKKSILKNWIIYADGVSLSSNQKTKGLKKLQKL